jgi:hypothetical protein
MSIGLYGDSFGSCSLPRKPNGEDSDGMKYHWSTKLQTYFNCDLVNYADSGSSVYYSYSNFLKTHHLHEKIIFLITGPGRYTQHLQLSDKGGGKRYYVGLGQVEWEFEYRKRFLNDDDLEKLNDLKGWFKSLCSDYDLEMISLMLDRIAEVRPDVIFIPCGATSLTEAQRKKFNFEANENLFEIYTHQINTLKIDNMKMLIDWTENSNFISGHLVPEYNEIAYKAILGKINTGKWNVEYPEAMTFGPNVKNYYIKVIKD